MPSADRPSADGGPPHRPGAVLVVALGGPEGLVALRTSDGAIAVGPPLPPRGRGRELLPAVISLLERVGLAVGDLGVLAVEVGPGSFTGIRLGTTLAKTLAFALAVPVATFTSLEALATAAPPERPVLALRAAGRGTWYVARFGRPGLDGMRPLEAGPEVALLADAAKWAEGATCVYEDAAAFAAACEALESNRRPWIDAIEVALGPSEAFAALGPRLVSGPFLDPHDVAPLYVLASAPERLAAQKLAPARDDPRTARAEPRPRAGEG